MMSAQDRDKWNARYEAGDHACDEPSLLLTALADLLPDSGRALDVAGGAGRHAIWLAQRGLEVTLVDVSPVGLELAEQRARAARVSVKTVCADLEDEPLPAGPWQLIVSFHYLWRPLFESFSGLLAPGGVLVFSQPTRANLQRHRRPPERFLLDRGELPKLVQDLDVVSYQEGWLAEGRHDALIVARRSVGNDLDATAQRRPKTCADLFSEPAAR